MTIYRYLDRPLGALPDPRGAVVAAMRNWVVAVRACRCPCGSVTHAFERHASGELLAHFNMMMAALDRDASRMLRFGRSRATCVTEDEAAILALLDTGWAGDADRLGRIGAAIVKPAAVGTLVTALSHVAALLPAPHGTHAS